MGPNPISYRDLADWMRITKIDLRPWELNAILTLDRIWMASSQVTTKG